LTETPSRSSQRSQSPKRVQERARSVQAERSLAISGKASRKGSSILPPNGDGVQDSPMISVVTPCVIFESDRRSVMKGTMECDWMSMNPGHTTIPLASMTSALR
jgi:hypothetical protein